MRSAVTTAVAPWRSASRRSWRVRPPGWRAVPFIVAGLILLPIGAIAASFFSPATDIWRHLLETTLAELLANTFWLALGVGVGAVVLGVALAWLTAVCEFPGRRLFAWALLLPLALPAYVTAFVALSLFDFAGPVQTWLRATLPAGALSFPDVRSRGGVIVVMTLALYPYVYLLARNAFMSQGKRTLEAARSLGLSPTQGFFRVALPLARPWIASGALLALMETLADFGAVAAFNYDTFTTAIYKTWFGLFSLPAASQLASLLVLLAFVLLLAEQRSRAGIRFAEARPAAPLERIELHGGRRWLAFGVAGLTLTAAFLLPLAQLLLWAFDRIGQDLDARYLALLWRSLLLAGLAALLTAATALAIAYAGRLQRDPATRLAIRVATLGYALPGAVLAVGLFSVIVWLDRGLGSLLQSVFGFDVGLLAQGSLLAMLLAYVARFLAVGHGPIDSALHRITPSLEEAARSLGVSGGALLRRVHLPLLRGGVLTALTLTFVDVIKEMPITLMLRPFGWDTLAVRIFELSSEGEWRRAALPAVTLVVISLPPVALLLRSLESGPIYSARVDIP